MLMYIYSIDILDIWHRFCQNKIKVCKQMLKLFWRACLIYQLLFINLQPIPGHFAQTWTPTLSIHTLVQNVPRNIIVKRKILNNNIVFDLRKKYSALIRQPTFTFMTDHILEMPVPGVFCVFFIERFASSIRINVTNYCKGQRRDLSRLSTVMFCGTPCLYHTIQQWK